MSSTIEKKRPHTQAGDDRKKARNTLKVEPTQCIWTDLDTNRKYLIDNKGSKPVYVNQVGQIPSRFNLDVTGVLRYKEWQGLASDDRLPQEQALAMKCETPKSLGNIQKKRHQYYTPIPQKFFGYAQMPRQMGMPY